MDTIWSAEENIHFTFTVTICQWQILPATGKVNRNAADVLDSVQCLCLASQVQEWLGTVKNKLGH